MSPSATDQTLEFGVHASHYLARARTRLAETEPEPESLLYAGLELRCGVESRMKQYLETQTSVSAKLKKGYQIAKLARGIEAAFRIGERYVRFTVEANDHEVIAELWHTPLTAALRRNAEWCGNILHAQRRFRQPDDSWWSATRERLQQMAAQLVLATRGELIGAPLRSPAGQIELSIEYPAELALHDKLQVGSHHTSAFGILRARHHLGSTANPSL